MTFYLSGYTNIWRFMEQTYGGRALDLDSFSDYTLYPVSEFNEFEPRLKSAKNRFQLNAGLNLEKLNTILSGTNHI